MLKRRSYETLAFLRLDLSRNISKYDHRNKHEFTRISILSKSNENAEITTQADFVKNELSIVHFNITKDQTNLMNCYETQVLQRGASSWSFQGEAF